MEDSNTLVALCLCGLLIAAGCIAWARRRPKPPIALVCGATGVGKSTLINVLLGREASQVGTGEPVTLNTVHVAFSTSPFAFYDSRGLEVEEASQTYLLLLSDLFRLRYQRPIRRQIDLVLMCIAEPTARFDGAHEEIANLCEDLKIPLGIVLTKSQGNNEFQAKVRAAFTTALFVHPVRALPLQLPHVTLPAEGVQAMSEFLSKHVATDIGEARRRAIYARRGRKMAELARSNAGVNSDRAWVYLAESAYRLLLPKNEAKWDLWLAEARRQARKKLVPDFITRHLFTKFDNDQIDGSISRRVFPRIVRRFGNRLNIFLVDAAEVANEALPTLQEQKPYRSRF